jgi:hypothetical protein
MTWVQIASAILSVVMSWITAHNNATMVGSPTAGEYAGYVAAPGVAGVLSFASLLFTTWYKASGKGQVLLPNRDLHQTLSWLASGDAAKEVPQDVIDAALELLAKRLHASPEAVSLIAQLIQLDFKSRHPTKTE